MVMYTRFCIYLKKKLDYQGEPCEMVVRGLGFIGLKQLPVLWPLFSHKATLTQQLNICIEVALLDRQAAPVRKHCSVDKPKP